MQTAVVEGMGLVIQMNKIAFAG